MSIRTHIPWIDFSGSSTKFVKDGCNSSYKYSAFNGLGTRNFNFTHISEQNSCGYNSYGCGGYGGIFSKSYGSLYGQSTGGYIGGYSGGYSSSYYSGYSAGHCHGHGGSNWFTKFTEIFAGITMGLSLGKQFGGLFSKDVQSNQLGGMYQIRQHEQPDDTVYRDQPVMTITKEKDPNTGKDVYKIKKTTVKVKSEDGSTEPLALKIDNKAGVYLNDKNEIVWQNKITTTKEKIWNEEKKQYEIKISIHTEQVPSKDGKTDDITETIDLTAKPKGGPEDAGKGNADAGSGKKTADDIATNTDLIKQAKKLVADAKANPSKEKDLTAFINQVASDYNCTPEVAREKLGMPDKTAAKVSEEGDGVPDNTAGQKDGPPVKRTDGGDTPDKKPATVAKKPTRADLENPPGLENITNQALKAAITSFTNEVLKQVDTLIQEAESKKMTFNVDYSSLPTLQKPNDDLDQAEVANSYKNDLTLWLAGVKVQAAGEAAERKDINIKALQLMFKDKGIDESRYQQILDSNGNDLQAAINTLNKEIENPN